MHNTAVDACRWLRVDARGATVISDEQYGGYRTPACHLGGRIQILVRSPDGAYQGYNGMTEVPASYIAPDENLSQGYGTIATPGVVAGLGRLHR